MSDTRDDLRTRVAKAIAGPIVAKAFGKHRVDLRMGEKMPPNGCGPGTAARVEEAYRQADAVIAALPEQHGAAGPEQAVRGRAHRDEPRDHMEVFAEFWADLVMRPDGTNQLDRDRVARELADYSNLLSEIPLVYDHITGGLMSKPNYAAADVIAVADDRVERIVNENMEDYERAEVRPLRRTIAEIAEAVGGPADTPDLLGRVRELVTAGLELQRARAVIAEYVNHVESGEKFGALVELVPGLVSDDGAYGAVDAGVRS